MAEGVDHVVIGVHDLDRACADYARAGFTVTPGGEHAGGATHNALASFADGTYLELIAFTRPEHPVDHRWWDKIAVGEGLIDFALRADDVDAELGRLLAAGIEGAAVQDGGRVRPDGQRIAWRNLVVDHAPAPLPFMIEDVTVRGLRVPGGPATEHPLGVSGVAGLTIAVADLDASAAAFATFLGSPGSAAPASEGKGIARRFAVGPHYIELAQPTGDGGELAKHLAERGEGPFALLLRGATDRGASALSLDLTHGARISVEE